MISKTALIKEPSHTEEEQKPRKRKLISQLKCSIYPNEYMVCFTNNVPKCKKLKIVYVVNNNKNRHTDER